MHTRSKPALAALGRHSRIRTAATATKVAPRSQVSWPSSQSPATPAPSPLGVRSKWAREDVPPASTPQPGPSSSQPLRFPQFPRPSSSIPSGQNEQTAARQPPRLDQRRPSGQRTNITPNLPPSSSSATASKWLRTKEPLPENEANRRQRRDPFLKPKLSDESNQSSQPRTRQAGAGSSDVREDVAQNSQGRYPEPRQASFQMKDEARDRRDKRRNLAFKDRGSLIHRHDDATVPSHSRHAPDQHNVAPKPKKKPTLVEKRVKVDVFIPSTVAVGTLARLLKVSLKRLQRRMQEAGMGEDASYDHVLTSDYAVLLAEEFGRNPVVNDEAAFDIYPPPPHPNPSTLPSRPPVVTIMGHVDHGKTTLLDTLRSSSVAAGEAGGITQHIGAFSVPVPANADNGGPKTITFLDTPGHAAFSAMRARGASVTDIVVLVVAADDGVMPQTKEVIELVHKDQDKVQLIVAINKVDKPEIDLERVQNELMVEGVQLEALSGDIPAVQVSGLTGLGLDQLVETISAVSEMQDLRAEQDGLVYGYVLESKVQKGLGPTATVLVLRGGLNIGNYIICGTTYAKVRVMTDSAGKAIKVATPGMAVTVSGWKELPSAGDEVLKGTEQEIKKAITNRLRKAEQDAMLVDVEAINVQRRLDREQREAELAAEASGETLDLEVAVDGPKELRLVLKGDVSGSVEAVTNAIEHIGNDKARVKVISTGVGEVTESDVLRAKASGGMIIAFSVPVSRASMVAANSNSVPVYSSSIIYQVMDEVTQRVTDLLPVEYEKKVTGEANVLQIFDIHLSGKRVKKVAGSRITNGVLEKNKPVQVVRNGKVIYEGRLETFRHLKNEITEASKGMECGLGFSSFDDLKPDDVIQVYQDVEKPKSLY
ncbi:hypothetical protein OF83DRAFT_1169861 [Amylostereum chailletii]|nr:hypothetical protein OF83DRAFT_1169861 [Amylostereum chailletii]